MDAQGCFWWCWASILGGTQDGIGATRLDRLQSLEADREWRRASQAAASCIDQSITLTTTHHIPSSRNPPLAIRSTSRAVCSSSPKMIKIWSMKKDEETAKKKGTKTSSAQLRVQKGELASSSSPCHTASDDQPLLV